jgi:translocation and assembly module TamB
VLERINIAQVSLEELLIFDRVVAEPPAQNSADQVVERFSFERIQQSLRKPPSLQIPEIFIPINLAVKQTSVNRICWQVAKNPSPESCISLTSAALSIEQQRLKAELQIKGQALFADSGIIAEDLVVSAELNLQQEWQHDIRLSLLQAPKSAKQAELRVHLQGKLTDTLVTASIIQANTKQTLLTAQTSVQLSEPDLPIQLSVTVENIAPAKLFLISPFEFDIPQATLSLEGTWEQYRLRVQTKLQSFAAQKTGLSEVLLDASISPQDLLLAIDNFETDGALGTVKVLGSMQVQRQAEDSTALALYSDLALSLRNLDLGVLNPDLQSDLNGDVNLSHVLAEQWMQGTVGCTQISGAIFGYAISLQCDMSLSRAGEFSIKQLSLVQANNSIKATGSFTLPTTDYIQLNTEQLLQTTGQLSLDVDIVDASQFHSQLKGRADIQGRISGKILAPNIQLTGDVSAFSYDTMALQQASIKLSLDADDNYRGNLDLNVSEFAVNTTVVNTANISASGDKDKHSVQVEVQSNDIATQHAFEGGLTLSEQATRWRGKWLEGSIDLPFSAFRLDSPAYIVADIKKQSYSISDHCWATNSSNDSICLSNVGFTDQVGSGSLDIVYDIASIARFYAPDIILPDTRLPLQGKVNASYSKEEGLSVSAYNNIIGGEVETPQHLLALTAIVANFTLQNDTLSSAMFAGTQQTGIFGLQSTLKLKPQQRLHSGRLRVDNFDLSLLQRFIPSTQNISGMVNADIQFDGKVSEPELTGQLDISSGELILDAYAYPLTDFHQSAIFNGTSAAVEGGFQLGKGSGSYSAVVNFTQPFSVAGNLQGEDLQVAFSNSIAQVSPELEFAVSPTDLMLKGSLGIPSATIKIEELPENARTPSSDTIIIGKKVPEPMVPLALDIDIDIFIDKAERGLVTVDALDLSATLAGKLDLQVEQKRSKTDDTFQALRTTLNGQVNVLDGSYEAYGQMLVVQSGKIFFNGEPSLPQFNIRAIRNPLNTEGDVIAGLHITGNPVVPRVELFSEPPMIQAKQLSYLLQGSDLTARGPNDSGAISDTALINALIGFGVGRSDNRIGKIGSALGIDSLNLQTAGAGDKSQVQITGRISDDIQITYGIGVFDQTSQVKLKYQILPQLFIEAQSGVNSAVDLFYQISRGENPE